MAVAFDARMTGGNSSDGFSQQATGTTTNSSTGMTVGAGATMLVGIVVWGKSGLGQPSARTMTWNGVSMTERAVFGVNNASDSDLVSIFTLDSPATGNRTLAASWTTAADSYMSCISVTGSNGINATNTVQASGTTATITSATGNMTVAAMTGNGGAPTTNFTQIFVNAPFAPGGGASRQAGSASNAHTFTGSGSSINAVVGIDIVAAAGGSGISATLGVTESGDTIAASATSAKTATANIAEAADTIVAGLTHGTSGFLTVTEASDTIVAGATQTTAGIGATFTVTEASDTVVAGLTHGANFSLTVTEASDTVVSGATLSDFANLNVTEASDTVVAGATLVQTTNATFNVTEASDTIVSGLTAGENFTLTVTEASDTVVAGMTAGENASLNVTEASDTIVASATTLLAGINATFTVTEASDAIQAGLSSSVTGNVNVTEGSDTCFGQLDTGNPAVVVTTAGAGSGGARKKRLYILPDGTRIYATPSEIAQILKLFYQKKPEEKLTKKQKKFADVVFTQDFEPTEKVVPKVYELKPQYKRVQQLDYVAFLDTLRKRDEEEFMMMMEVF